MGRKQCRICRSPDNDDLISVQLVQEQVTIAEMILAIAGVSVTSDRRLPQNICLVCLERLKEAYQLRRQCIEADAYLREEIQPTALNYLIENLEDDTVLQDFEDVKNCSDKEEFVEILEVTEGPEYLVKRDMLPGDTLAFLYQNEETEKCSEDEQLAETWQEGVHYVSMEALCLQCCGCSLVFNSEQELKVHSVKFHRKAQYRSKFHPLQCTVCYQTFTSRKQMEAHRTETKAGWNKTTTVFQCVACLALSFQKKTLFDHLAQHNVEWTMNLGNISSLGENRAKKEEIIEDDEHDLSDCSSSRLNDITIATQDETQNGCDRRSEPPGSASQDEEPTGEHFSIVIDFEGDAAATEEEMIGMDEEAEAKEAVENMTTMRVEESRLLRETKTFYDGQKYQLQKAMCRIPQNNLQVIAKEEGYLIVELVKHRCCCCSMFFKTPERLEKHVARKRQEALTLDEATAKYICEYCGKQFEFALRYVMHKKLREQRQFYMCGLCNMLFESETRMKSHMLHTEEHAAFYKISRESISDRYESVMLPGVRCCYCWKYFDSHEQMLVHFDETHKAALGKKFKKMTKLPYACGVCARPFAKQEKLEHHFEQATKVLQHFCKLCDFQTRNARRIELHLYSSIHRDVMPTIALKPLEKTTTKLSRLRYCCFEKCKQPFRDVEKLHQHVRETHADELKANKEHTQGMVAMIEGECFECDVCGQLFKHVTSLKMHQSLVQGPRECVCSICGIKKRSRAVLLVHERTHTGEKPYACDFCDKTFSSRTTLNSHQKCHGPKKFECAVCKEMFARLENLKRHIRLRHSEATFQCEACPKMFKTRDTLTTHMRVHTGEKPYKCRTESCDKWYTNIGDRRRHEMSVHTLERPHKCSYCNAAFIRKRQLVIHERRHTGDKPFVCTLCGKGFFEKSPLNKHSCNVKKITADKNEDTV